MLHFGALNSFGFCLTDRLIDKSKVRFPYTSAPYLTYCPYAFPHLFSWRISNSSIRLATWTPGQSELQDVGGAFLALSNGYTMCIGYFLVNILLQYKSSTESSSSLLRSLSPVPNIAVPEIQLRHHCFSAILTIFQIIVAIVTVDTFYVALFVLIFLAWSIGCFFVANSLSSPMKRNEQIPEPVLEKCQLLARFLLVQITTLVFAVLQLVGNMLHSFPPISYTLSTMLPL
jgi:hypothetical protein